MSEVLDIFAALLALAISGSSCNLSDSSQHTSECPWSLQLFSMPGSASFSHNRALARSYIINVMPEVFYTTPGKGKHCCPAGGTCSLADYGTRTSWGFYIQRPRNQRIQCHATSTFPSNVSKLHSRPPTLEKCFFYERDNPETQ